MTERIKTQPAKEPMTLQEAKNHLVVDHADNDSIIDVLIVGARKEAEDYMERALITQTWELFLDHFPKIITDPILVPRPPLIQVTSIKYIDDDGVLQTLANTEYDVDAKSAPGRILPAFEKEWPDTRRVPNAVTIEFLAGYGTEAQDVPQNIVHGMKLTISEWHENRGGPGEAPQAATNLWDRYMDFRF